MSSRSQCRGIQRHRYIPSQSICEGTWRYVIFVCQNLFNQRFRCSPSRDLLKTFFALNPRAHGKQSRQFASSNMMKKNNSVHIRVPINSSKITNQRLLFVVFIRTPPKNMQKIFRLLLWYFCTNSVKMLAMKPVLWSSYRLDFFLNLLVMLLFQETFPSSRFIYALNTNFEGTSKLTMSAFGFDLIFLRFFHALSKELIAMECFDVVIFSSLSLSRRSKASIRTKFKPNYTGLHYEKTMSLALPGRIHQCNQFHPDWASTKTHLVEVQTVGIDTR